MVSASLVSVLLPVFQAEKTLDATLRSVARQTHPRWHCVIVDDGSTDGSAKCAGDFASRDRRFEVLRRPHRGLVATLNDGLTRCHGRYVARIDADDLMHRRRLERQVRALDSAPQLAGVGCHVRLFPRATLQDGLRSYERWLCAIDSAERVRRELFIESPLAHPTWLIRREIFEAFPYRDAGWPEDYDLLQRLHAAGEQLGVVPERLVSWREHPGRLTRTGHAYRIGEFPRLKAAFLAETFLASHETYVLWGYGHTGRALRRALLEYDRRPSRIVEVHPGRLGQRIHGAPVIPPADLVRHRGEPVVASVAGEGPRSEVRGALDRMGFVELRDFVCAA